MNRVEQEFMKCFSLMKPVLQADEPARSGVKTEVDVALRWKGLVGLVSLY